MKPAELRKQDIGALQKLVVDLRKKLSDSRFTFAANTLKNVKEMRNTKKEIARILTIIREQKTN